MRREPDPRCQAERFDVRRQGRQATWKLFAKRRPIATFHPAGSLPAIVDLNILGALLLQLRRNPLGVPPDLFLGYVRVVVIPGAPTRRRHRKSGLIDRLEVLHPKRVAIIVALDAAVLQTHRVRGRIVDAVSQSCLHIAQSRYENLLLLPS